MKRSLSGLVLSVAFASVSLPSQEASACGACFHQEAESMVVTGHRMAVSLSPVQSVLWDQIQYSGDPAGFAWVLPVRKGAYVEVATDAWFETLDAGTSTNVVAPLADCGTRGQGCGCPFFMGPEESAPWRGSGGADSVTVLHSGTVGPYETVTIETSEPLALETWLVDHGYAIQPDLGPTIDAYVAEGFHFIALRLAPDSGIHQMKPVRVVTPGPGTTLPLRMVAGGTDAQVPIVLYVIAEGRFETVNFPTVEVARDKLFWDYLDDSSNYAQERADTLAANDGRTFASVYAQPRALLEGVRNPVFGSDTQYPGGYRSLSALSQLYFDQARRNGEANVSCTGDFMSLSGSTLIVKDPCPPGVPFGSPECVLEDLGIDAGKLVCGSGPGTTADDLAVSLIGLRPNNVWVTRLEAELPHGALSDDLVLGPAKTQKALSNWVEATFKKNEREICGSAFVEGSTPRREGDGAGLRGLSGLGLCVIAFAWFGRRAARLSTSSRVLPSATEE